MQKRSDIFLTVDKEDYSSRTPRVLSESCCARAGLGFSRLPSILHIPYSVAGGGLFPGYQEIIRTL